MKVGVGLLTWPLTLRLSFAVECLLANKMQISGVLLSGLNSQKTGRIIQSPYWTLHWAELGMHHMYVRGQN
jgi:hypothetical protein